jgi:hypothetical protein
MIDTRYVYEIPPVFSVVSGGSYPYQIHRQELFLSLYAILESTTELWQQRISPNLFNLKSTEIQITQTIYFINLIL